MVITTTTTFDTRNGFFKIYFIPKSNISRIIKEESKMMIPN